MVWQIIFLVTSYFLWTLFAYLMGTIEGWYWAEKYDGKVLVPFNEHILFTLLRSVVGIAMVGLGQAGPSGVEWYIVLMLGVSMVVCFPFWHNGRMYEVRNNLDERIYKQRFWSSPPLKGRARQNYTLNERLIGLGLSLAILVFTIFSL